jgi:hypothetical protein
MIEMSRRMCFRFACALAGTVVLVGCTGGRPAARHPAVGSAAPRPARQVTMADARRCPETIPGPAGSAVRPRSALFGWAASHGNGKLWVGGLWPHGVIVARRGFIQPDGSIYMKFGWWRKVAGALTITGQRLDAPAPPLTASVPSGYGDTGFQASGVFFPTEGCWQVTGKVASTSLTFVTFVIKKTHGGTRTAGDPVGAEPAP